MRCYWYLGAESQKLLAMRYRFRNHREVIGVSRGDKMTREGVEKAMNNIDSEKRGFEDQYLWFLFFKDLSDFVCFYFHLSFE